MAGARSTRLGTKMVLAAWLASGCTTKTLIAVQEQTSRQGGNCSAVGGITVDRTWESAPLAVVSSELSPAVMVHTSRPQLSLFDHMGDWGLGAPTHVALSTPQGIKTLDRAAGASLDLPVSTIAESWMLFWFRDAAGFTTWDCPWLVVWQHRPTQLVLDDTGLTAHSAAPLGYVAMMPLYGHAKQDTSGWTPLPNSVIERCRSWAKALREYPIAVDETFRLDPSTKGVTIHSQFTWLSTEDDWQTLPSARLAPLSPSLGLALQGQRMPMSVSGPVTDPELFTSFGPYLGVADTDCHEVTFPVLDYVTSTEKELDPDVSSPIVASALSSIRAAGERAFESADDLFHQDFETPDADNTCWALMSEGYYGRALPYLAPDVAAQAKTRLHRYFGDVLQQGRFQPFDGKLLLVGPGVPFDGQHYAPAGNYSSSALVTLYTYAHATGDWDLIRDRWPLIKMLFITPRMSSWRSFGRENIAEMGDEAAPALAMARLAYFTGDMDVFGYATYVFARELVHHVVKHTGAPYFRAHPSVNDAQPLPADVYLTRLFGDTVGWQLDGPTYPANAGERYFEHRWVRFGDPDVARFHRDNLRSGPAPSGQAGTIDLEKTELDDPATVAIWNQFAQGAPQPPTAHDDPHILPSLVRLRSLLLDDTPQELSALGDPSVTQSPASAQMAYDMSFLRTRPRETVTLISDWKADSWAKGLSREAMQAEPSLGVAVSSADGQWPSLTWGGTSPPTIATARAGGDRWSFGQIAVDGAPVSIARQPIPWSSAAVVVKTSSP